MKLEKRMDICRASHSVGTVQFLRIQRGRRQRVHCLGDRQVAYFLELKKKKRSVSSNLNISCRTAGISFILFTKVSLELASVPHVWQTLNKYSLT